MKHIFHLEKQTNDRKLVIHTCVFGSHFLQNERSKPVPPGKQLIISVANDKIEALTWKLELWEACVCCCGTLKNFSDEINNNVNECDLLILYKLCYYFKYLPNCELMFSKDPCMTLQNHACTKDPLKVQGWPIVSILSCHLFPEPESIDSFYILTTPFPSALHFITQNFSEISPPRQL